jgi:hypothetical protein
VSNEEAARVLQDLLNSDLATRRVNEGGLKTEEKRALKVAIKQLNK